ncbi:hypothetical protein GF385_00485 [Candidatus Dependentiae bacterium]|nr:hypothetical protein [Candidatus Dependentiae bacterium]
MKKKLLTILILIISSIIKITPMSKTYLELKNKNVELKKNTYLKEILIFKGKCVLNCNGFSLKLEKPGKIILKDETTLYIKNNINDVTQFIENMGKCIIYIDNSLKKIDPKGKIIL